MPTNRFNYSDDFVLNNGKVGINSASPQEKLDVVGVTKAENLNVVGVSSLTGYEGFLRANHNVAENTSLEGGQGTTGSLSGEIVIGTGVTVTGVTTATSGQGYIDSLKVYNTFTVPVGLTTDRPTAPKPGQLYYNKDFATIEFFDGDRWRQVDYTTQRGRGVWAGGQAGPAYTSAIEYITISTTGNAQSFGQLTTVSAFAAAVSSNTRGFWGSRYTGVGNNTIDYITIASEGNAIDFGDSTAAAWSRGGLSSSTRGIFFGGNPATNVIEYITMSTIGNALDFGDISYGAYRDAFGCSSPTRGVFGGGEPGIGLINISFINIASTGNSTNFGNLTDGKFGAAGVSNTTRGIFAGGTQNPPLNGTNVVEYITITSTGNATDFGDLTVNTYRMCGTSSQTRGVFNHGTTSGGSNTLNSIDYVTIATAGNAIDFGDSPVNAREYADSGCSDSHGGLGGF